MGYNGVRSTSWVTMVLFRLGIHYRLQWWQKRTMGYNGVRSTSWVTMVLEHVMGYNSVRLGVHYGLQ